MKRLAPISLVCSLAAGAFAFTALSPTRADACGGTFCDGGTPQPMPVDQSGENILFVVDGDLVEAHIQIQYEGDPEKFGWVIPLTGVPEEIAPGSEPLFLNLLAGSVPMYGIIPQADQCQAPSPTNDGLTGNGAAGDSGGEDGGADDGMGPDILLMQTVGAFEVTVLSGGSAEEIVQWLDDNNYQQDDASLPILQEYIDEGHVFAAVKLSVGAGVDEIHPIMLRFQSSEPCVPLRLTRIAAVEDMDIRTFFLGDGRVVPRSYRHVEVNPLKIDWPLQGANYKEVITLAVDAEHADGRAFVTEYAGASEVVQRFGIIDERWNASAFVGIEPASVIGQLTSQGLFACGEDFNTFEYVCRGTHPLVQPLLDEFLPVPAGVDALDFYENTASYADQIDLEIWDDVAFSEGIADRIIGPGQHANDLLDRHRYLTRMYTTISPAEMTEDPMFHVNMSLPVVDQLRQATQRILCNGDSLWTLPDGREVYVPAGEGWPDFDAAVPMDQPMPTAEFVDEVPASGAPMRLLDNAERINAHLLAYNEFRGWNGSDIPEGQDPSPASAGGCGCTSGGVGGPLLWSFGLGLGLLGLRRRRT